MKGSWHSGRWNCGCSVAAAAGKHVLADSLEKSGVFLFCATIIRFWLTQDSDNFQKTVLTETNYLKIYTELFLFCWFYQNFASFQLTVTRLRIIRDPVERATYSCTSGTHCSFLSSWNKLEAIRNVLYKVKLWFYKRVYQLFQHAIATSLISWYELCFSSKVRILQLNWKPTSNGVLFETTVEPTYNEPNCCADFICCILKFIISGLLLITRKRTSQTPTHFI